MTEKQKKIYLKTDICSRCAKHKLPKSEFKRLKTEYIFDPVCCNDCLVEMGIVPNQWQQLLFGGY